jgi:hypothetical protein
MWHFFENDMLGAEQSREQHNCRQQLVALLIKDEL